MKTNNYPFPYYNFFREIDFHIIFTSTRRRQFHAFQMFLQFCRNLFTIYDYFFYLGCFWCLLILSGYGWLLLVNFESRWSGSVNVWLFPAECWCFVSTNSKQQVSWFHVKKKLIFREIEFLLRLKFFLMIQTTLPPMIPHLLGHQRW